MGGISQLFSLPHPLRILDSRPSHFHDDGIFEGGEREVSAILKWIKLDSLFKHHHETSEEWVFRFEPLGSGQRHQKSFDKILPFVQVRYLRKIKPDNLSSDESVGLSSASPAELIFLFEAIADNQVRMSELNSQLESSHFVKKILMYPPIEGGDMAIKFLLKENVWFRTYFTHRLSKQELRIELCPTELNSEQ